MSARAKIQHSAPQLHHKYLLNEWHIDRRKASLFLFLQVRQGEPLDVVRGVM